MRVNKKDLSTALRELARVAPSRPHLPILGYVVIEATNGTLKLRTTDLDTHLSAEIPCDGDLAPTCLPLKSLAALAKPESKKDDGLVSIEIDSEVASIAVDGVTSKMACLPAADFPATIPTDDLSLVAMWPAAELREALAYAAPAASKDVTRPHICGVSLSGERAAATDGHRLHLATLPSQIATDIFVPRDAAEVLVRMLDGDGPVVLARTDKFLRARRGAFTLDARLPEVNFPDVDQAVPSMQATQLTVERDAVKKAMNRVAKLTGRGGFKMVVNGSVMLSANSEDGSTEFELPRLSNNHEGEDLVIGFSAKYVTDAVGDRSGAVRLSLGGCLDPLLLTHDDGRLAVVMPMRT